jgi:signal transduction histidine kinase
MKSNAHPESVLVVDDDSAIRSVLSEILSREGYQVRVAENGAQALDGMRLDRPDVVVLDLMMPVMSGWEVLVAADQDLSLREIPILVASAMAAPVAGPERHGGVRSCLAKPLDIPALLEALRAATMPCPPSIVPRPGDSAADLNAHHLRVLMVEDSPDDADLIQAELRRAKYTIHAVRVATKSDYVEALEREPWDVILSDIELIAFSGVGALEILISRGLDIPFVVVSGTVGEDVAVGFMKAGAQDFFPKRHLSRLASAVAREVRAAGRRRDELAERSRAAAELERLLCDLRAAVKVRDDFLSIASHELKTPLTSLQLEVQLLQRSLARDGVASVAEKLEVKLATLARQITRLTTLVNDLLDVARHAPGESAIQPEPMDLQDVVRGVLAKCEDFIRSSGSMLAVSTASVKGSWDPQRIESVVRNLLLNAVKYGEGRPIEVMLDKEGATARLIIADHGIGIASEEQKRIFEKFERAVPLEHFGGFGLGLWSARQAVVAHGGEIRCESRKGSGSKFTVLLPLTAERT